MEDQAQIGIYIATGCLAMLSLALLFIAFFTTHRKRILEKESRIRAMEHEKQIESFKAANEAEEKERQKIAKNLHDGILPSLSIIQRSLEKSIKDHRENKFDVERLKKDVADVEQVIMDVRGVSHDLIPPALVHLGVVKTLGHYVKRIGDTNGSGADYENRTTFGERLPFSLPEQHTIYRICLELLNNLSKHAGYNYLKVVVENDEKNLAIEFIHDGKGVNNEDIERLSQSAGGLGLRSLKSRATILNAVIDYSYDSDTAGISLNIPFKP